MTAESSNALGKAASLRTCRSDRSVSADGAPPTQYRLTAPPPLPAAAPMPPANSPWTSAWSDRPVGCTTIESDAIDANKYGVRQDNHRSKSESSSSSLAVLRMFFCVLVFVDVAADFMRRSPLSLSSESESTSLSFPLGNRFGGMIAPATISNASSSVNPLACFYTHDIITDPLSSFPYPSPSSPADLRAPPRDRRGTSVFAHPAGSGCTCRPQ